MTGISDKRVHWNVSVKKKAAGMADSKRIINDHDNNTIAGVMGRFHIVMLENSTVEPYW